MYTKSDGSTLGLSYSVERHALLGRWAKQGENYPIPMLPEYCFSHFCMAVSDAALVTSAPSKHIGWPADMVLISTVLLPTPWLLLMLLMYVIYTSHSCCSILPMNGRWVLRHVHIDCSGIFPRVSLLSSKNEHSTWKCIITTANWRLSAECHVNSSQGLCLSWLKGLSLYPVNNILFNPNGFSALNLLYSSLLPLLVVSWFVSWFVCLLAIIFIYMLIFSGGSVHSVAFTKLF